MNTKRSLIALGTLLLVGGCKVEAPRPPLVETVGVLLFDNESNTLDAPDIMQKLVYLALKPSGYRVKDFIETNEFLEKAGFLDGGQLAVIDPVRLGTDMGVQALLFGYVENFNYTNIGFYQERKVSLNLKMVDVNTGAVIWENSATTAMRKLTLDQKQAQRELLKGLAEQLAEKIFDSPLEEEARATTLKALRTLPGYKFCGWAKDDSVVAYKSAGKVIAKDIIRKK